MHPLLLLSTNTVLMRYHIMGDLSKIVCFLHNCHCFTIIHGFSFSFNLFIEFYLIWCIAPAIQFNFIQCLHHIHIITGYYSFRNTTDGAHFIQAFLSIAEKKYKICHVEEMLIDVRRELAKKPEHEIQVGCFAGSCQTSVSQSTYIKKFFL